MMIVTDGGGCDDDSDRWWYRIHSFGMIDMKELRTSLTFLLFADNRCSTSFPIHYL